MNKALFSVEKINTLTWTDSRLNDPIQNRRYKIYRKKSTDEDSAFTLIYTADSNSTSFTDRMLAWTDSYVYRLTVIDNEGHESPWLEADEH
jgi:fibronectin type 3 domain-containing protein